MPKHGINKSEIQDLKWRRLPPSLPAVATIYEAIFARSEIWVWPHITHCNSGQAWLGHTLGHCHTCHMSQAAEGSSYAAFLHLLWSHLSAGVYLICTYWALDTGPTALFCAGDTRGSTKGAAAWYYPNCLQLYLRWGGTNISTVIRTHFIS